MNKISVLIADDHALFRTGVRKVLEAEDDMTVVGEAATGREALEQARTLTPDVILMDIKMPDPKDSARSGQVLDGIEATRTLCREMPHIGIIFVTMFEDDEFIFKGLQAGGRGYILKDSDPDGMLRAIRAVARGESLLGPSIAQKALRQFSGRPVKPTPPGGLLVVNRFEINNLEQDLLGRGGMGDVYRATDIQTGESVAVKALNPDIVARDPGILERFVREGEALRQLNHPNIVKMLAAVEQAGQHYLVMEYVAGGSLQDLLAAQGPLPGARVVEIALDLADALTRAHRLGIIHRDLKPANVLLAKDGTPRLADFGIAHMQSGQRLTQTGVLMGTIDYLCPEICQGQPPDERADIWAFGVTLFEMLTGRRPFEGDTLTAKLTAILTEAVPDLTQLAPDIPGALASLVNRMLEKDLQLRIPSVRLVGAELEAILKGWAITPAQPGSTDKIPVSLTPSSSLPPFMNTGQDIERPVFVTRESELAQLHQYLDRSLEGHGQVVFVTGDPGQGKTALALEFAWRAQSSHPELVVASGNCNAFTGIGDPYLPFREILGLLCGDIETRWEARAIGREQASRLWQSLPLTVQALVDSGHDLIDIFVSGDTLARRAAAFSPWPERGEWLPRLEQLVERKATTPGDPDFQQSALFEQYTRVVRALARHRPLLLMLDDLQWADSGSTHLLFHLGKRIEGSRIMLLGAYRPTEVALGRGEERHPLEPVVHEFKRRFGDIQIDLEKTDGRQFVDAVVDSEPNRLDEDFRAMLYRLSGGHPLGTIELLRDMQERGGLVRDPAGQWVEGPTLDWETLPARVEGMIAERIERLDDTERQALRIASVEGETFTAEIVAQVLGTGGREMTSLLSNELDKRHHLVSAQNIRRLDGQRLATYRFRHILFQRYLYNSLDPVERSQLHHAIGTALQTLYGEGAEEIAVQLARHFQEAGIVAQAAGYLSQAGDRASELIAHQEAIDHYQQAMTAYRRALGDRRDPLEQAVLERKIGEALFRQGKHPLALEHLRQALSILGKPLPTSRWKVRLAILLEIVRQIGHRLLPRVFLKPMNGPPTSGPVSPAVEEEFASYNLIGWIDAYTNPERYLLADLKALNAAEHNGFARGAAIGSTALGIMLDFIPIFWLAEGYHRRGMAFAKRTRDPDAAGVVHFGLALHHCFLGEWDKVIELARRAAKIYWEAGDLHKWGFPTFQVFLTLFYRGDLVQALAHCQELVRCGQERADPQVQCWGWSAQGLVQRCLGQFDEAIGALQQAIELAKAVPDYAYRISASADLGRCYLRQGNLREGWAALQESQAFYVPYLGRDSYASLRNGLAEACLLAAERDKGEKADWLNRAGRACQEALKQGQAFRPGLPEAMCLRGTYEWLRGKPAAARKWWQRSLALAEKLGQRYDLGMAYLEMGLRLGDRAHLERAEAILAEIGAGWDLDRARTALGEGSRKSS